jgi:hypothetical protein
MSAISADFRCSCIGTSCAAERPLIGADNDKPLAAAPL